MVCELLGVTHFALLITGTRSPQDLSFQHPVMDGRRTHGALPIFENLNTDNVDGEGETFSSRASPLVRCT